MTSGFRRTTRGRIILRVDQFEKGLLSSLLTQIENLVAPEPADPDADPLAALVGIDGDAPRPEDPALARLLPDAYPGDEEASSDFRRFTERGLRETKAAAARSARQTLERSGEKVVLTADEAVTWMAALNDVRLALGTRLGVTEDLDDRPRDLPDDDPVAASYHVYDWLTWLQDSLVVTLMERADAGEGPDEEAADD